MLKKTRNVSVLKKTITACLMEITKMSCTVWQFYSVNLMYRLQNHFLVSQDTTELFFKVVSVGHSVPKRIHTFPQLKNRVLLFRKVLIHSWGHECASKDQIFDG